MKIIKTLIFCLFVMNISIACQDDKEDSKIIPSIEKEKATIEGEILKLVNQYRKAQHLAPLKFSSYASKLCKEHNDYMISRERISHDNFKSRYQKLNKELKVFSAAENVASGYKTANKVMKAWLNSPGHKNNIIGDFTHIGINAKKNSKGVYYFTQIFYK